MLSFDTKMRNSSSELDPSVSAQLLHDKQSCEVWIQGLLEIMAGLGPNMKVIEFILLLLMFLLLIIRGYLRSSHPCLHPCLPSMSPHSIP